MFHSHGTWYMRQDNVPPWLDNLFSSEVQVYDDIHGQYDFHRITTASAFLTNIKLSHLPHPASSVFLLNTILEVWAFSPSVFIFYRSSLRPALPLYRPALITLQQSALSHYVSHSFHLSSDLSILVLMFQEVSGYADRRQRSHISALMILPNRIETISHGMYNQAACKYTEVYLAYLASRSMKHTPESSVSEYILTHRISKIAAKLRKAEDNFPLLRRRTKLYPITSNVYSSSWCPSAPL